MMAPVTHDVAGQKRPFHDRSHRSQSQDVVNGPHGVGDHENQAQASIVLFKAAVGGNQGCDTRQQADRIGSGYQKRASSDRKEKAHDAAIGGEARRRVAKTGYHQQGGRPGSSQEEKVRGVNEVARYQTE